MGQGQGARSAPAASCPLLTPPFQPSTSPLPTVRKFAEGSDGRAPSSRLPVVFVHMHKSGGTVMCHLAHDNGERLRPDWVVQNCNDPQVRLSVRLGSGSS